MVRTQIQLTERQAALIRRAATERKVSMAEAIRQGIELLLQQSIVPDREQRIQRAMETAGRFRSGHSNTSETHDEVLAEAYKP
jgi:hypothetical protein